MKAFCTAVSATVLALSMSGTVSASEKGSAAEATTLLDKASSHFRSVGKDRALADFTEDKATYVDRDLYVFCFAESDGKMSAHGANKALLGRDMLKIKDANGKVPAQEMLEVLKGSREGWVDYMWQNPESKKIEPKSALVRKIDDQICGVGIYK